MSLLPASPVHLLQAVTSRATAEPGTGHLQAEVMTLFDEFHGRLLRYAISFGLTRHDAEDVLQEVFLALFRHLQAGRSRENLPGWVFRTTHNLSLKRRASRQAELRVAAKDDAADADIHDAQPDPEASLLFNERQSRLRAVVHALPELDQMCLRLRGEGLRYREIASTLGISLGSVAASLARSFARLQRVDAR